MSYLRKIEEVAAQFVADQAQKLADAERRRDSLEQAPIKAQTRNERVRLRAPIAGTVQQLAVATIEAGGDIGSGPDDIMPPDGPVEVEAMIQNEDIGFVRNWQPAHASNRISSESDIDGCGGMQPLPYSPRLPRSYPALPSRTIAIRVNLVTWERGGGTWK